MIMRRRVRLTAGTEAFDQPSMRRSVVSRSGLVYLTRSLRQDEWNPAASDCRELRRAREGGLVRRLPVKLRMEPLATGEGYMPADWGVGFAEGVADSEIDLLVPGRAPEPLGKRRRPAGRSCRRGRSQCRSSRDRP